MSGPERPSPPPSQAGPPQTAEVGDGVHACASAQPGKRLPGAAMGGHPRRPPVPRRRPVASNGGRRPACHA